MRQTLISPLVASLEDNPDTDSLDLTARGGVIPPSGIYPLTLCLNQQQTTQLLSAAWNGALLTYPDNPLQVLQPLLQALEDIGGFAPCLGENMLYRINDNCLFQQSEDGQNWTTLKDIANDCADFPILVTRVGGDGQTELRYHFRSEDESAANAIDRLLLAVWPTEFRVITESGLSKLQRRNRGFSNDWSDVLNLPRLSSQAQTVQHYPFGVSSLNVESGRILRFENGAGLVTVLPVSYISDIRIQRDGLSYDFDVQYNNLNDWRPYGSFGLPGYGVAVNSEQCRLELQADGNSISHIDIADLAPCLPDQAENEPSDIGLTNLNRCFAVKQLMSDLERLFQDVINAYQADRVNENRRQLIDDLDAAISPFLRGRTKAAKIVLTYALDTFKLLADDLDDDDLLALEASLTLGRRQVIEQQLYCQSVANGNFSFVQNMTNIIGDTAEAENYGEIEDFDGFELFVKDGLGTENLAALWAFYIQRGESSLCTSFDCTPFQVWEQVFDFTASNGGWIPAFANNRAEYVPTVGWGVSSVDDDVVAIRYALPVGTYNNTQVTIRINQALAGDANDWYAGLGDYNAANIFASDGTSLERSTDLALEGGQFLMVYVDKNVGNGTGEYTGQITRVVVSGTGVNPFL